jgi:RND family efflux transporter MFP subunit
MPALPPLPTALKIMALVFVLLFIGGVVPRFVNWLQLRQTHQELAHAIRRAMATQVKPGPGFNELKLPGNTTAVQQIPILARADGYLAKRYVDIGDNVKKGQLLGVISTPELDQQLIQSEADLRTARANLDSAVANWKHYVSALHAAQALVVQSTTNLDFSRREIKRYEWLARTGAVSWEVRDTYLKQIQSDISTLNNAQENQSAADMQAKAALEQVNASRQTVDSYVANMRRLAALKGYQKVFAPYDGVITARYVDAGSLISSGGNGTPILAMGGIDILRIFVQVPQNVFRSFGVGQTADVIVPEFPGHKFPGLISRVSGGLDTQSRTLQVEVLVDNRQHTLPSGVYAEVAFKLPNTVRTYVIPVNAVSMRSNGNFVAIMRNGKAYLSPIDIHLDEGATIQSTTGVQAGDYILMDPPDDLKDGEPVHAVLIEESKT